MEKLTFEQLDKLPVPLRGWVQGTDLAIARGTEAIVSSWTRVTQELIAALAPQPCGHPGACVVSIPNAEGSDVRAAAAGTTSVCGWCAAIDLALSGAAENATALKAERNALNTRLIECMEIRSTTKVALKAERDAFKNIVEDKHERTIWSLEGYIALAEARDERDALREKLKAAEGLAENLGKRLCHLVETIQYWGFVNKRDFEVRLAERALATWKEANEKVNGS